MRLLSGSEYSNQAFSNAEAMINGTGLLPNNRTHSFKFSGSYRIDLGLTFGGSFVWQGGTPLNEFGSDANPTSFIQRRGKAGTTPWIWDLNLRMVYQLPNRFQNSFRPRFILDVFHVAGQREAVNFDQQHFFCPEDECANPSYNQPTAFQPPMAARFGLEVDF